MSNSLLELASTIVSSHASVTVMSTEELLQEIQKVYAALQQLEITGMAAPEVVKEKKALVMTLRKAFQADQVFCMICGKGGMKTLARHLSQVHGITPREYRKQFNIPATQTLTAKNFSEKRRQTALDRGLADNLAKARAVRAEKLKAKKPTAAKASKKKG
ncbi:MAG: MucR family transcriptional regulator [Geobacteraceae bacterium]|nr:MucR family transcriptional regulator [Geobacteraceae bacterium]